MNNPKFFKDTYDIGWLDDGCGGRWWCRPIIVAVLASYRRSSWPVMARGHRSVGVERLSAAPGPLGPVDGGSGGCDWWPPLVVAVVALSRRGRRRVAAWLLHGVGVALFCAMWGLSLDAGGQ